MRNTKGIWGTATLVTTLACAGGSGQTTTTAASLGDAGSTMGDPTTSSLPTEGATSIDATEATSAVADTTDGDTGPAPTSDSSGSPSPDCDRDPEACTAWILPTGANDWVALSLDPDSTLAPTDTVRAAFDIEAEQEGFVLTDTRLHVVDLASRQWIRTENRDDALPDLGGDEILGAYSIPGYWGEMFGGDPNLEGVTFLSATTAYIYDYEIDTQTFVFDMSTTDFGASWDAPEAPSPAAVRATWLDVTNDPGWVTGDVMQLCGVPGEPGPYSGYVANGDAHIADAGYCFGFYDPVALSRFAPFGLPGAPQAADIGAMLYSETMGLWVLRGQ